MTNTAKKKYERVPYLIAFKETSGFKDTYAGEIGRIVLESHLLRPVDKPSKTVILFMHPIGGGQYLPLPTALAKAGHHVIYCNSRYRGTDSALIMEKVALDMGACIRDAKERMGYGNVILGGWSGGGSLSLFYQSQAENPTVKATPAGEGPDLTQADLIPADGVMLLAAHKSRAETFTEWLDPSILDEQDPSKRDRDLNIYDPKNPNQPPYTKEYVARFRQAQIDRNRRITSWVQDKLQSLRDAGKPNEEHCFTVYGTMADPKWLDKTIDPNDRKPNWCFLGEPEVVNMSPIGLARFCSLRSWLSQWSYDLSNAKGPASAAQITAPCLVVGNSADDGITPEHTHTLYNAIPHDDKEMVEIEGANHYYFGQPELVIEAASLCSKWLSDHNFA